MTSSTPSTLSTALSNEDQIAQLRTDLNKLIKVVGYHINKKKKIGFQESNELLFIEDNEVGEETEDEEDIKPFIYYGKDGYVEFISSIFPAKLEKKCKIYPKLKQMRLCYVSLL
jgi:hypothetical protein